MLKFQITLTEWYTHPFRKHRITNTPPKKRTHVSVLFTHSRTARLCQLQPRSSPPLQRPCREGREKRGREGAAGASWCRGRMRRRGSVEAMGGVGAGRGVCAGCGTCIEKCPMNAIAML